MRVCDGSCFGELIVLRLGLSGSGEVQVSSRQGTVERRQAQVDPLASRGVVDDPASCRADSSDAWKATEDAVFHGECLR